MKKATIITRALSLLLALLICFGSGLQLTAFADSSSMETQYSYWRFSDGHNTAYCGFEGGPDMQLECSGWRNEPMKEVGSVFYHEYHSQLCFENNCFFPHGEVTAYQDENGEYWYYEDRRSVQVTAGTDEAGRPYCEMSFYYGGQNHEFATPGSYYSDSYRDYAVALDDEIPYDIPSRNQMSQTLEQLYESSNAAAVPMSNRVQSEDSTPTDRLVRIKYPYSGGYLMVESDENGSRLKQKPLDPNDERYIFRLHQATEDGYCKLYTLGGKVIDAQGAYDWAEVTAQKDGGLRSKWDLISDGDTVKFCNANSGKMLNIARRDGEEAVLYHADGTPAEVFELQPVDHSEDFLAYIQYAGNPREYLTIPLKENDQAYLWENPDEQKLVRFHHIEGCWYQIFTVTSSSMLTAQNADERAPIRMGSLPSNEYALWKIIVNPDNTISLQNKGAERMLLNVAGGGAANNGAPLQLYHADGTVANNFHLIVSNHAEPISLSSKGYNIVAEAKKYLGLPYVWGGYTLNHGGFDCAGFVSYVYTHAGIGVTDDRLTFWELWDRSQAVSAADAQPGDLVFFENTYQSGLSHVGIYLGNGQMIHACDDGISYDDVNGYYWKDYFHSFRRFN